MEIMNSYYQFNTLCEAERFKMWRHVNAFFLFISLTFFQRIRVFSILIELDAVDFESKQTLPFWKKKKNSISQWYPEMKEKLTPSSCLLKKNN